MSTGDAYNDVARRVLIVDGPHMDIVALAGRLTGMDDVPIMTLSALPREPADFPVRAPATTDTSAISITAMFMMEGLMDAEHKSGDHDYLQPAQEALGGRIGLVAELQWYAVQSEIELSRRVIVNFPGVYDYEVSSEFGIWFAGQCHARGDAPPRKPARLHLNELIDQFFNRTEVPE